MAENSQRQKASAKIYKLSDAVNKEWIVQQKSENVHLLRFKYKANWEQYVLLASDIHFDNSHCKRPLFKKHLEQAKERNAPVIIPGDLLCLMQGKYDPRKSYDALLPQYKTDDYFGAIIDDAVKFFEPYKKQLAVIGYGNHETSVLKRSNVDMIRWLCRELGSFRGGYRGFVRFLFQHEAGGSRQKKTMFYTHGAGGGGPVTRGVIKHNRRASMVRDVDIILSGHIHESWVLENEQFALSDQHVIKHKKQLHIQCPTYKDEIGTGAAGWANEKEFPPKPLGGWWLKFSALNNTISVSVERAE